MSDWWRDSIRRSLAARVPEVEQTYFAMVGDVVKVGFSKDPEARMEALRYGRSCINPEGYDLMQLTLLGSIPGGLSTEGRVHMLLHDYHVTGEWFRLAEPVVQVIDYLLYGLPMTDLDLQAQLWAYLPEHDPEMLADTG